MSMMETTTLSPGSPTRRLPCRARWTRSRSCARRSAASASRRGCSACFARFGCGAEPELLARAARESVGHEVVRVLDHVANELVRQAAVERDRVPVALVQVVAGADRAVGDPELNGELRLALDADLERRAVQCAQGE